MSEDFRDTIPPPKPKKVFDTNCTITFKDISYIEEVPVISGTYQTVLSPIVDTVKSVFTKNTKDFYRVKEISGIVSPGKLKMVISPPGHGKSTYLKMIANRLELQSGNLAYNGRDLNTADEEGVDLRKLTKYCDQTDCLFALQTVFETLDSALRMSSVNYTEETVDNIINMLGLEECRNTMIGDEFVKGVSGGQRRRVSIGETLCSDASVIFLDEPTNGLDSATSEDIFRNLRKWAIETNSSIVSTLQQPTPGLFETFDEVVILREGQVVFDGPRDDVLPFFDAMGYKCPDDVDVCDFLIDVLTQPRLTIDRQRENLNRLKKSGKNIPEKNLVLSSGDILQDSSSPCVTTEEMVRYYKSTPIWEEISTAIDLVFPPDKSDINLSNFPSLTPTPKATEMYSKGYIMPVYTMLHLIFMRQLKLTFRNGQLIVPRIINSIFMGLVYGSLYYHIKMNDPFLRVALFVTSLTLVGFGNMVELPIAVSYHRIVQKQMANNLYMPWVYVVSFVFSSVPLMLVEVSILSLFLYFMTFNTNSAACFFTYFAISLMQSFNLSTYFKCFSTMKGGLSAAQAIAGTSAALMMNFGGFFVTLSNLPVWMQWMMWVSPYSWSTRALANNEFLSHRYNYDYIDPISGISVVPAIKTGYQYLNDVDMHIGEKWIGYNFLYLACLSALLMIIHSFLLYHPYFELSIGTRRTDIDEMLDSELDREGEGVKQLENTPQIQNNGEENNETIEKLDNIENFENIVSQEVHDASAFNQQTLKTLRESLPFNPTWLSFSHIKYTVQVQQDGHTVDRVLLSDVSGYAEPGKLTALMGASGAGKTTLLDVLAGRKNAGVIEGNIMFNGQVPTPQQFAAITGYVEQFDSLFAYDTVIETLLFAARLRLPSTVPDEVKIQIVHEVMETLDLTSISNYIIGNYNVPGLSPSQLKRVNIGVELVANPSLLYLDEPTTGLDSKAAQTVMRVVKRIARSGRAIICTIHQPSAELAFLFDRLVLLGSGGHQIFFGDVGYRFTKFIKYLESVPGVTPCPPRHNPASWMLEELGVGINSKKPEVVSLEDSEKDNSQNSPSQVNMWENESSQETIQRFKKFYFNSPIARRLFSRLHALEHLTGVDLEIDAEHSHSSPEHNDNNSENEHDKTSHSRSTRSVSLSLSHIAPLPTSSSIISSAERTSLWYQLKLLQYRHILSYWRNPPFLFSRAAVLTVIALAFGCIYFDLKITSQSSAIAALSSRSVTSNFGSITHGSTCLPIFFDNRPSFYRERLSNYYNPGLYSLVQVTTEMFYTLFTSAIYCIILYFMINMKQTAEAFFLFYLAFYLMSITFICMACLFVSISPSIALAGILQGTSFSFFLTFTGIAISIPNIKAGWLWVYHMLPMGHITAMLASSQFEGLNNIIGAGQTASEFIAEYLSISYGTDYYFQHFGWVCLFLTVIQTTSYISTYYLVFSTR